MNRHVRVCLDVILGGLAQVVRVLPIKRNRVVCIAYRHGSQYADSPRIIAEYLDEHYPGEFEIVWVFEKPGDFECLKDKGIKLVKYQSLRDFYYANTAGIYISNLFGPQMYVVSRKGKLIIETTHGVAYKSLLTTQTGTKSVGKAEQHLASRRINRCNLALSGSVITSDTVYRKELGYRGEILAVGLPRNDVFFRDTSELRSSVCERLHIDASTKIALIMPTWHRGQSLANVNIDYAAIREALERNTGDRWVFILRLHHLSNVDISEIMTANSGYVFDATRGYSSQEILCSGDLLITDYSSVIWDFALRKLPILIYTPDLDSYEDERGFNIDPADWGLMRADTSEGLVELIETHSEKEFIDATEQHLQRFGNTETGRATEVICERIVEFSRRYRSR